MNHKVSITLLFVLVIQLFAPILGVKEVYAAIDNAPSSRPIYVTNQNINEPGYYWCQRYNGDWQTDSAYDGIKYRKNTILNGLNQPEFKDEKITTRAKAVLPKYYWYAEDFQKGYHEFALESVVEPDIDAVISLTASGTADKDPKQKHSVLFTGVSGAGVKGGPSDNICGHMPGFIYPYKIEIKWKGYIPLSLEVAPTQKSISINDTYKLKATSVWGYNSGTKRYEINPSELQFKSSDHSKVVVSSDGTITGIGAGTAIVKAYWSKWDLAISTKVTVMDDGTPAGDFDPVPNKVPYGDSFTLVPKNINIPSGKTLKSITYKIYNPARTQHTEFSTGTITNVTIDASKYPRFIEDKEQSYPIDMFVTDSKGRVSPTVTKNVQITKKGVPIGGGITGDFEITPSKIKYRDTFNIVPKDIKPIDPCKYTSHVYKIDRQGYEITTSPITGMNTKNRYDYANYPPNVGVGYHDVYMKIYSSCGETEWIGPKPLIIEDNGNNTPPVIKIGFVDPAEPTKRLTQVVQGTTLDLVNIYDESIPVPYDADGDELEFLGFDFSRSTPWGKTIPSISTQGIEAYHGIYMGTLGVHRVDATAKDAFGGLTTATTYINVIPANPIPVIECPKEVTANKQYNEDLFSSKYSYSPKKYGRIDHSRDEWLDRLPIFKNDTDEVIDARVGLHVYDTDGLKSLEPAYCTIKVKPDIPPIAKLDVPEMTVRNEPASIVNNSYSPDGDKIVTVEYKFKYDKLNDGFHNDSWEKVLSMDLKGFEFSASKVGKYLFYTKITEEGGRWADTSKVNESILTLNVINRSPEVSFDLSGMNKQPPADDTTVFSVEEMNTWELKQTNSDRAMNVSRDQSWTIQGGLLYSGKARNFYTTYPNPTYTTTFPTGNGDYYYRTYFNQLVDYGLGTNGLSPYRAIDKTKPYKTGRILTFGMETPLFSNGYVFYRYYVNTGTGPNARDYRFHAIRMEDVPEVEQYIGSGGLQWRYKTPYTPLELTVSNSGYYDGTYQNAGPKYVSHYKVDDNYLYVYFSVDYYDHDDYINNVPKTTDFFAKVYSLKDLSHIGNVKLSGYLGQVGDNFHFGTSTWGYYSGKYQYKVDIGYATVLGQRSVTTKYFADGNLAKNEINAYKQQVLVSESSGTPDYGDRYRAPVAQHSMKPYTENLLAKDIYGNSYYMTGYRFDGSNQYLYTYLSPRLVKVDTSNKTVWSTSLTAANQSIFYLNCQVAIDNMLNNVQGCQGATRYDVATDNILFTEYYSHDGWHTGYIGYKVNAKNGIIISRTPDSGEKITQFSGRQYDFYGPITGNSVTVTIENKHNPYGYQPVADGKAIQWFEETNNYDSYWKFNILTGTPTTEPRVIKTFTSGQLFSPIDLSNVEMKFNFKVTNKDWDRERLGFSFRMQSPFNKYAIEFDGTKVYLMKYVNGAAHILAQSNQPLQDNKTFNIRLRTLGDKIEFYINNTPVFNVTDGSYVSGAFGYFSDKAFVHFGALSYKPIQSDVVEWMDNYAIWEPSGAKAEVKYENINFDDPEKDPMAGKFTWSYKHTPMFLRNQGVSSLDGKSFESTQLTFDKVGRYVVSLQAKDDPHPEYLYPDNRFNEYRMDSNEFVNQITVHRRPVAKFQVSQQADGMINWNDESYDPDRWMSPTEISKDNTGIDYAQTRGILERKYYYISPTGKVVDAKLTAPQEKGMYEIGLSVKDEYGAWSQWAVNHIDVGVTIVDSPPLPGFIPNPVATYRNVDVSFQSTAYDKEDGNSLNLDHKYYISNMSDGKESLASAKRDIWYKQFSTLGTFKVRQVVTDSSNQSAETSKTIQIINRVPVANISYPDSTNQTKPTLVDTYTPTITWTYADEDLDQQKQYEVKVYKYGGILIQSSGVLNGTALSWKVNAALQDKTDYYVVVRVFDGYDWGQSAPKYMRIHVNSPPIADFDYIPKPPYEGDTIRFSNKSTDPDGDPMTYKWQMSGPNYRYQSSATNPTVSWITPGSYMVTLTVSDGMEEHSITKQIEVLPLCIQGQVMHAKEWLNHLQKWNEANPDKQRSLNTFWAGESFELVAKPTVTGTATTAVSIKVYAERIGQVQLAKRSEASWEGYLSNDNTSTDLAMLADGEYSFVFTVTYSNGVQKTTTVPINILGNWDEYFRFHRSF